MKQKCVFCIADSMAQTSLIVERLSNAGFSSNAVSVLFPDKSTTRDFAFQKNTKAPEGAATGAGTGGALGGALGWLVGIGALAIPGLGPFIAAGPILAALGGVAVGATVGGIAGALIGMGIPEFEAKRYEGSLREGGILISVHADTADEIYTAKTIFELEKAKDISTAGEAAVGGDEGIKAGTPVKTGTSTTGTYVA